MPMPTCLADLTYAQNRALRAILAATVKKTRDIRSNRDGHWRDEEAREAKRLKRKKAKVGIKTIVQLRRRAWVAQNRLIERGHTLETLESLRAEIHEIKIEEKVQKQDGSEAVRERIIREEVGWLQCWPKGEKGNVWTLTAFAAYSLGATIGEHWEYEPVSRPRKDSVALNGETKTQTAKKTTKKKGKKSDTIKVRAGKEMPSWVAGDLPNGPVKTPRFKGECELADWMSEQEPSREMSPLDEAIAREEIVMQDVVREDGHLEVNELTQQVRREPVTLWGEPMVYANIKGKKTTSPQKQRKPKSGKKTTASTSSPTPIILADRPGATAPGSGIGELLAAQDHIAGAGKPIGGNKGKRKTAKGRKGQRK